MNWDFTSKIVTIFKPKSKLNRKMHCKGPIVPSRYDFRQEIRLPEREGVNMYNTKKRGIPFRKKKITGSQLPRS